MPPGVGYNKKQQTALRAQVEKMAAAGVPKAAVAEVLSKRFRSAAAQSKALDGLINKYGGSQAKNMQSRF